MGIKQHFVALHGIGHDPERAAASELAMGDFETAAQPANPGVLAAPVKLKRFTVAKGQRHERFAMWRIADLLPQLANMDADAHIAPHVTLRFDGVKHDSGGTTIALRTMAVGLQPGAQLIAIGIDDTGCLP